MLKNENMVVWVWNRSQSKQNSFKFSSLFPSFHSFYWISSNGEMFNTDNIIITIDLINFMMNDDV